ncbi:MAG TPA: PQQ-binding-like beta-propeller repeat protein [Planctomycetota bacterium]|nr:PQQ-binding-like beta-propeller repeat protein [Planctomycetota bacterium]
MSLHRLAACLTLVLTLCTSLVRAENWPNWRGPHYDGSTTETNLPDTLDLEKHLAWKAPLPGQSGATPIIWGDKVFVSSADAGTKDLLALCFNRADGNEIWRKKISTGDYTRGRNNMATPSPVTDGQSVFFLYGNGELAKLDFAGNILWQKNITSDNGPLAINWGYGNSPLLFKDKLYITVLRNHGNDRSKPLDSFLLALNPKDGSVIWRHVRESDAVQETLETYATPMPVNVNGKDQLLINDGEYLTGHDAETGKELWRFGSYTPGKQPDRRMVVSPVAGAGFTWVTAAKHASPFYAIKLNGASGTLKTSQAAWNLPDITPDCCTSLFYSGSLFVFDGDKKASLVKVDPDTGDKKWTGSLAMPGKGVFRASPTGGDGKIYLVRVTGEVYVISAGDEFKILSELSLGEGSENVGTVSSVALSQGNAFVRTPKTLYCFKK